MTSFHFSVNKATYTCPSSAGLAGFALGACVTKIRSAHLPGGATPGVAKMKGPGESQSACCPWGLTPLALCPGEQAGAPTGQRTLSVAGHQSRAGCLYSTKSSPPTHTPSLGSQLEGTAPVTLGSFSIIRTPFSAQQEPRQLPCWDQILAMP